MAQPAPSEAAVPAGLRVVQTVKGKSLIIAIPLPPKAAPSTAPSASMRVVQAVKGESLIIAIPRRSGADVSEPSSSADTSHTDTILPTYDRAFWGRFAYTPILLKISTVLRSIGLRQRNSGPGVIQFEFNNVDQLADSITNAAKRMPDTLEELVDAAVDQSYEPLREDITDILHRFGNDIWRVERPRPWLLDASNGNAEYRKDLEFGNVTDDDILKYHLRLWVLIKAFNRMRNRVRPFAKMNAQGEADAHAMSSTNKRADASFQQSKSLSTNDERVHRTLRRREPVDLKESSPNTDESSDVSLSKAAQESRSDGLATHASTVSTPAMAQITRAKRRRRRKKQHLSEEVVIDSSENSDEDVFEPPAEATSVSSRRPAPHDGARRQSDKYLHSERDISASPQPVASSSLSATVRLAPNACLMCSRQHQRCDRATPKCGRCIELSLHCEYVERKRPRATTFEIPERQSSRSFATEEEGDLISRDINNPDTTRKLLLDKYWDREEWQFFYTQASELDILLATMRSLGLKATPRHPTHFKFTIENYVSLGKDVNRIARALSSEFSAVHELIERAEDPNYLDAEIDALFENHSLIWSLDSDRTKLLAPGVDENYPKDLFYEESEDQRILWIHLHRWIFIVALQNCEQMQSLEGNYTRDAIQQRGDAEATEDDPGEYRLDDISMLVPIDNTDRATPLAKSDVFASAKLKVNITKPGFQNNLRDDAELQGYEDDLAEALGQYSDAKGKQREILDEGKTTPLSSPDTARQKSTRQQRKRKDGGSAEKSQDHTTSRPPKQRRTSAHHQPTVPFQGYDLAALLVSYLENHSDPKYDELAALENIEQELSALGQQVTVRRSRQKNKLIAAFFNIAFPAWLAWREEIVTAKRSHATALSEEPASHHHQVVIERSRLATQLRQAHEAFVDARSSGMRPEEVVFQAVLLLGDEDGGSATARALRKGFQSLEDELVALADALMESGGRQFVLSDFEVVAGLEGLRAR